MPRVTKTVQRRFMWRRARVSSRDYGTGPAANVAALIEAGADPGARDEDGKTPFDYAKEHNGASWENDAYWRLSEARFA